MKVRPNFCTNVDWKVSSLEADEARASAMHGRAPAIEASMRPRSPRPALLARMHNRLTPTWNWVSSSTTSIKLVAKVVTELATPECFPRPTLHVSSVGRLIVALAAAACRHDFKILECSYIYPRCTSNQPVIPPCRWASGLC